ncbi:MAG TPA: peroxiredoxin [Polyangiaceae bacterium]
MATRKSARRQVKKAGPQPAKKKTQPAKAVAKAKPAKEPKAKEPKKGAPAKAKAAEAKAAKAKQGKSKPAAPSALAQIGNAVRKVATVAKAVAKVAKATVAKSGKQPPAAKGGGVDVGSRAPSFSLKDQNGDVVDSASLAGAPYVLYFYPKDDTSGCTKEACGFRDSFKGFGKAKARVIGVSPDSEASHERFAKKYGLPFTLLSDPDKELANAYGVWVKKLNYGREYLGIQRSTFLVDANGNVARAYRNVRVDGHVPSVLEAVQAL